MASAGFRKISPLRGARPPGVFHENLDATSRARHGVVVTHRRGAVFEDDATAAADHDHVIVALGLRLAPYALPVFAITGGMFQQLKAGIALHAHLLQNDRARS